MVSCSKVITFPSAAKMLVKFGFLDLKNAGNDVSQMFLSLL